MKNLSGQMRRSLPHFAGRQVQCEGGSGTPACGDDRPSRAKPEWMHVVCTDPPESGRIQRIYLAWENRRTDPKWTAHKKGEVIGKFGPWMDFWMLKGLKGIRKIPVHKTWTKNVVDRDWFHVPAGTPGPVAYLFARCCSPAKK